ncbi:cellulase family glycosylhydrolase [Actinophytocola oryzae]|uniref:Endoglucanase n=1 Tax=Actinophytocola oryzae TaxID=502181 RepID=A0A4R7VVP1_9PSEU|nr:cellulase family glycosylhydrolase [Actinophytocola oryzae]TDV54090.1 cellulose binding domain-containing protein [Actinophytocola oryzae]
MLGRAVKIAGLGLAAAAACAFVPGAAGGTTAAVAFACRVDYSVSEWGAGFSATVKVDNLGTSAVSGWTVTYSYAGNQTLQQGWNGTWSQSGRQVTVTNASWNATIPAGGSVSPGANFGYSGTNAAPTDFAVNGAACTGTPPTDPPPTEQPSGPAPALRVSGNKLLTAAGATYRLLGVNRSSGEFACVQGKGMWDSGPVDQASVNAMLAWHVRAVRIPLNEDCWLGLSGSPSGATYQQAVKSYVTLLVANGINPILDLHWTHGQYTGNVSACADVNATCQKPMPSMQYTPTFWTQVANAFKGNNAVVFDLFNEPYPDAANNWSDMTAAWRCLRDGGTCTGFTYEVAGMQDLVDAVRATGATNVVMTAGLTWTNDLSQWLTYKPTDRTGNLMASWHSYNFNACVTTSCWDSQIGAVAAQVPVHAGEIGQDTCAHDYVDQVMAWLDRHGLGYTAWTWNPWGCGSGNVLIQDYNGTPTSTYGEGYRAHLLSVA